MKRIRLEDSLDLIARKVIMSSLLYYGLDRPVVSDSEYDNWCKKLNRLWFKLDPLRQWQLGTRQAILATGMHIKVTQAAVGGSVAWLAANGINGQVQLKRDW